MATYSGLAGKVDEEGGLKALAATFRAGVFNHTVTQRGAGANMSVDVNVGTLDSFAYFLFKSTAGFPRQGWIDATVNVTVTTSSPSNPRIDALVAYIDLSAVSSSVSNSPGSLKFMAVAGTAAASPTAPSGATIQAAVGALNPYLTLRTIAVGTSVTTILNANLTDTSVPMAMQSGRLWGGSSNTKGHSIPNQADGVIVTTTDTASVSAQMMGTGAITLGTGAITVAQTLITSEVDVTGMSATVTVPTGGRKIKVSWTMMIGSNTAGGICNIRIKEGATQIGFAQFAAPNAVNSFKFSDWVEFTPTAGSHTYKISAAAVTGTINIDGVATNGQMLVEAV